MIKEWKIEQAKRLEEKDKREEEEKIKLRESAKRELDDWYAQHSEQVSP